MIKPRKELSVRPEIGLAFNGMKFQERQEKGKKSETEERQKKKKKREREKCVRPEKKEEIRNRNG